MTLAESAIVEYNTSTHLYHPNKKNKNRVRTISSSSSEDGSRRSVKFWQLLWQPSASEEEMEESWCDSYSSSRGSHASAETFSARTSTSHGSPRGTRFHDPLAEDTPPSSSPLIPSSPPSPFLKSPWIKLSPHSHSTTSSTPSPNPATNLYFSRGRKCLVGSLLREEGHVYSLAVKDGMLYTGSESKNIRVWRNFHEASGFRSGSGFVKAIQVASISVGSKDQQQLVFTAHQDGKIRVWSPKGKRVGTLPRFGDYVMSSMNPKNYVEARRNHKVPKMKHWDAVSCMSLNQDSQWLYSGSWDKSIKVWRISDGKCLESWEAHDDAINSIAVGYDGLVFSGSADGTVKVWRRELDGTDVKHFHLKTLLKQKNAVTALAVAEEEAVDGGGWVLYAGSSDGLVNFWERDEEEGVVYGGVLRGHKLAVLCLATAGNWVLSGSTDKTICVWNRESRRGNHSCLAVLSGHCGPVKCLAVEQDHDEDDEVNQGRDWIVYSGSLDRSVKIWRLSDHALLDEQPF